MSKHKKSVVNLKSNDRELDYRAIVEDWATLSMINTQ